MESLLCQTSITMVPEARLGMYRVICNVSGWREAYKLEFHRCPGLDRRQEQHSKSPYEASHRFFSRKPRSLNIPISPSVRLPIPEIEKIVHFYQACCRESQENITPSLRSELMSSYAAKAVNGLTAIFQIRAEK